MFGLTPKKLIIDQLKKQFKAAGLKRVMFTYSNTTGLTTAKALTNEGKTEPLPIEKKENSMIKNMLVKQIKSTINFEFTEIIADIQTDKENITIAVKNLQGELIPFEF